MYTLHYAPDNASLIVRLVLEEIGQPYRTVLVDRSIRQQDSTAYRQLNPNGLIPALVTPEGPLFETAAILLWLSERHGALAPRPGAPDRGAFLSWLFFVSNTLHPALRNHFYPERYAGSAAAIPAFAATTRTRIAAHLGLIDKMVQDHHPAWLSPAAPSSLGYYLGCCLRWVQLYPKGGANWFDITAFPALLAIADTLQILPASLRVAAAEGLGPTIFTHPTIACPPEGSAT
ncbi:MAG: glutathione S-transferase family protein [Albidovulum sp.]